VDHVGGVLGAGAQALLEIGSCSTAPLSARLSIELTFIDDVR
jgi:hypothetical protein